MAEELDYAEFGLPSEFFTEDFFVEEKGTGGGGGAALFPSEFPYEWGWYSEVNSPGDSAAGTDASEEEDYLAGLTWQMAHYFLRDDEKKPASNTAIAAAAPKGTLMVGSPQSILCAVGSWNDEFGKRQRTGRRGPLCPPARSESFSLFPAVLSESSADGYCPGPARGQNQETADHPKKVQLAATWRQHEMLDHGGRPAPPQGWSPTAAAFRPQPEPGSRAVLLGAVPKRGVSCGTGVFLPRQLGRPSDLRKKQGVPPTVLLPARVVQALNLDVKVPPPLIDHDITLSRSSAVMPLGRGFSPPARTGTERFLPADWTY
ncbi:unnamed protein product [Spirodela intermedia]|uniref:Uncharacterized protein n=1 Tax=Spirodela intermedia TaxID=51605 RepID=A0A7I8KLS3_SPIIN|nr:unnamed protein product [Spirodela intermedia]